MFGELINNNNNNNSYLQYKPKKIETGSTLPLTSDWYETLTNNGTRIAIGAIWAQYSKI